MNKKLMDLIMKLIDAKIDHAFSCREVGADGYRSAVSDRKIVEQIEEEIDNYLKERRNEIHEI